MVMCPNCRSKRMIRNELYRYKGVRQNWHCQNCGSQTTYPLSRKPARSKMESKPVYRMSSAGACPRKLSAERLGMECEPAPKWLETAAEEGRWHEERIKRQLEDDGGTVWNEQLEVSLTYPGFLLVGHIDGKYHSTDIAIEKVKELMVDDEVSKVLEVKSRSQYEFDRWMKYRWEGFPVEAAQITCYMEATGLPALYIVKNRSSGYRDEFTMTEPPMMIGDIAHNLRIVEEHVSRGELVPADYDPSDIQCKRCEFSYLCHKAPVMGALTNDELLDAARTWRKGHRLVTEGQELVDASRGVFEAYMVAESLYALPFDGLSCKRIKVHRESYPKGNLLSIFTEEQLEPALNISDYEQFRIEDMEEDSHD